VPDHSAWLVNDLVLGEGGPVTQVHVIVIIRVEAADHLQDGAPCGHVGPDEMCEWRAGQWEAPVDAAEYPVELSWEPARPLLFEHR
jgi:hypothetical protein